MSHHLHRETHTIEEAAPIAGHTQQRKQGLLGKATNIATGLGQNIVPGAGAGREFHVHP